MAKRRIRVDFKATKIVSKPTKVNFRTSGGKEVSFRARKDVPKTIRVNFLAKKKK